MKSCHNCKWYLVNGDLHQCCLAVNVHQSRLWQRDGLIGKCDNYEYCKNTDLEYKRKHGK
jgi:hypothetical protein